MGNKQPDYREAKVGDRVHTRLSKGAYQITLRNMDQVNMYNRELARNPSWSIIESASLDQEQCSPWPPQDVVKKLIESADILLNDKDYDGHGWELIKAARDHADAWVKQAEQEGEYMPYIAQPGSPCPMCGGKTEVVDQCLTCSQELYKDLICGIWMDADEEVPKDCESVLGWCCLNGEEQMLTHEVFYDGDRWFSVRHNHHVTKITHWQYMPNGPE